MAIPQFYMLHSLGYHRFIRELSSFSWLLTLIIGLSLTSTCLFAQLPSGFSKNVVQEDYTTPIGMNFSRTGNQFFVWEKKGLLWVSTWNGSSYVRQATPVLDIQEEVGDWNDFGLHSICFDPNYETNGLIYLFYQVDLHYLLYYGTPQYSSTANLYRHATISRVTRYHLQNSGGNLTTDYNSRHVLLGESITTGVPVTYESHAGGTLLFGRDGTLLLATGDGGHHEGVDVGNRSDTFFQESLDYNMMRANENVGAMRSQMVNSMCGKILRLDPATGNGVSSNPFYDPANPRSPQSRVWTLGLRNPYRMVLQDSTGSTIASDGNPGTLLIADVGWYKIEDFHIVDKSGLNCGWPVYEGLEPTISYNGTNVSNFDEPGQPTFESLCVQPTSFIDDPNPALRRFTHSRPALDYSHGPNAITRVPAFNGTTPITRIIGTTGAPAGTSFYGYCAIGGVYYTGNQFPANYKNTYFLTDHSMGWIKNLELHEEGDHKIHEVKDFAPYSFETGIVDMKMNPRDGSIYYVQILGTISRISYGGNQPPVASASSNVTYGPSPLNVQFTGSNSVDPEGLPLTYLWDFGDGTTSTVVNPTHVFSNTAVQKFTVSLTVTDNQGQVSIPKVIIISVNNTPPAVQITNPAPGTLYTMSQPTSYTVQANVTDTDLSGLTYEWQVKLQHNNHTHPEPILTGSSPVITVSPVGCSPNETYSYLLSVKVTDNGGLTATHSVTLYPDCNSASSLVTHVTATRQLSAVQVSWINPELLFDEILVAAREGTGFTDVPNGTSYTAVASFTGNGSPIEGGKVVYRGTGTSVTVTNLNPLVQYYFRVYTRVGNTWNGGVEVSAIPNLPPTAPGQIVQTIQPNQPFSYTVAAFTDPESQTLAYSAINLPAWLTFNEATRVLSGTATEANSYVFTIVATDPGSLTASTTVTINTGVCTMFTLKTGNWNDPTVWSCNRIPNSTDAVQLNHIVSIPNQFTASASKVTFSGGTKLLVGTNAKLKLSQ
jgi:PKD repeat protein/glucose/arabinose dehydrogenase